MNKRGAQSAIKRECESQEELFGAQKRVIYLCMYSNETC